MLPGFSLEIMKIQKFSVECTENSYEKCDSSIRCGPWYKRSDIYSFINVGDCSDKCSSDYIYSSSCKYFMIKNNLYQTECSENCFSNCRNTIFCSLGYEIKDIKKNVRFENFFNWLYIKIFLKRKFHLSYDGESFCPSICDGKCFDNCDKKLYLVLDVLLNVK